MAIAEYNANFRDRFMQVRITEDAKNSLIEELISKVEILTAEYERERLDLRREAQWNREGQIREERLREEIRLTKAYMERNPFVLVLIDGDGMIFEDQLLINGEQGGKEAAGYLHSVVQQYIGEELPLLSQDCKIVTRIYANVKGLGEAAYRAGIVSSPSKVDEFARGFTHGKQLFDFIDVGQGKDRADDKISEIFKLHLFDLHCKQIIFGCSHDNGYARILEEYISDEPTISRVALLEGVPFERELIKLQEHIKTTKFHGLFRTTKLITAPIQAPSALSLPGITRTASGISNGSNTSGAWAAAAALPPAITSPPEPAKAAALAAAVAQDPTVVPRNRYGQRIDPEIKYDKTLVKVVKTLKLCNTHYLRGDCQYEECTHDHHYKATKMEIATLRYVARLAPCRHGSECDDIKCMYGHRCLPPCAYGATCRFPEDMHNMDIVVVNRIKV